MKRDRLAPPLAQEYRPGLLCGVEKVPEPGLNNIWFVVPPPPPEKLQGKLPLKALGKANRSIDQLPHYKDVDEVDELISFLFVRREAVQSSRMEGTWSTIDHVLTPGELFDRKSGRQERAAVLGYAHALEHEFKTAIKRGPAIFSVGLASRLHRRITVHDPHFKGRPGTLRRPGQPGSVVFIGGLRRKEESIYNPAPPRHVARCLRETMAWMGNSELIELGDAGLGMTLPVRMAIGHSHFEAVHPFSDGNGRVGRILMTLQMACHGHLPLYLSGFIEAERLEYLKALGEAQQKLRYGPIVEFISEAIAASRDEAIQTRKVILELPDQWAERAAFRGRSAAQRSLRFLITCPIFTVKNLVSRLKVSVPTANHAVDQLVSAKIVRERTGFGRNRVFAAEEVIELLSRKFGDEPALALQRAGDLLARKIQRG
ncbi:MAG: Fic family protein [Pseudomonadota bacterium]